MKFKLDPLTLINNSNAAIDGNIEKLSKIDLGLCAQNILAQTRNLLDGISLYIFENVLGFSLDDIQTFNDAISKLKSQKSNFREIVDLYEYLETTASHFTQDQWTSIEIINVYADYLFNLKDYAKKQLNISILNNLYLFPFDEARNDDGFYGNVAKILNSGSINPISNQKYYYYIEKKKRIYTDNLVFYEYVVTPAKDKATKFDRTTCYSKLNLCTRHSYEMSFSKNKVDLFDKNINVNIIADYYVSIRPIELTNLFKVLDIHFTVRRATKGYTPLMNLLNKNNITLYKALFDEEYFNIFNSTIENCQFKDSLLAIKNYIDSRKIGFKTLSYLTCILKNRIFGNCFAWHPDDRFDNDINLQKKCLMFEEKPFALSLPNHVTVLPILFECLPEFISDSQLLQRKISGNTTFSNHLYTKKEDLMMNNNVEDIAGLYNKSLTPFTEKTKLIFRNSKICVQCEESDCLNIVLCLNRYKNKNFSESHSKISSFISNPENIKELDQNKIDILSSCFKNSSLLCIKGSAGTGKTFLINFLVQALNDYKFIFACNTHAATNNLRRRLSSITFKNPPQYSVVKQIKNSDFNKFMGDEILVLDECSTITNSDILKILQNQKFKAIILAGDDYQIESIQFGNWFGLCSAFFPEQVFELQENHRTKVHNLISLWNEVRSAKFDFLDGRIQTMGFIKKLSGDVFQYKKDQIVLCLNYDGLYGINNVNKYMQEMNPNTPVSWNVWTFKKDDPVLFTESKTFKNYFYSNQKGTIIDINEEDNKIFFTIRVDYESGLCTVPASFIKVSEVNSKYIDYIIEIDKKDNDDDMAEKPNFVVPFQLAYAISIHKSQGLEYENVKIIICKEIEESISFNVFYTAITRATRELTIFSNEGSLRKVIDHFSVPSFKEDAKTLYYSNKMAFDICKIHL